MATRTSYGEFEEWTSGALADSDGMTEGDEPQNHLLTENTFADLPWTEALLPLAMHWAATRVVRAVCIRFSASSTPARMEEVQTSEALITEAAVRLGPLMGDEDRLSRFSGNTLLLFSTRADEASTALLAAISEGLTSLRTESDGRWVPEIRMGMATLQPSDQSPVTMEAMNSLISAAEEATVPIGVRHELPAPHLDGSGGFPDTRDLSSEESTTGEESEPIMITRGHPERPAVRPMEQSAAAATAPSGPVSEHRLILKAVEVHVTGLVATALVDLDFDGRKVRGKAIGRSSEEHHLELVAEAMARAVTDLLPAGHGAVFRQAVPTATDFGEALVTVVEFLTPDSDEFLFGVAPQLDGNPSEAVAKSILSAVNHRTARMLDPAASPT